MIESLSFPVNDYARRSNEGKYDGRAAVEGGDAKVGSHSSHQVAQMVTAKLLRSRS
jgi:hypothetical protein